MITNQDPTYTDSAEKIAAILEKEFGSNLSQAFVLQKIGRKAETLSAMLRGMEPSNIFELLKMPPLLNLDYRVVFVNVTGKEEKIEPNDVPSFTLDDFINRLDTVAEKLTVLAYRNDPAALREQNDIPLRLFLHWGGATVSIRRTEITSSFHLIKRIENHLESRFLDENRVTGALSPGQLSEKLTRIINDIQGSGVNSAGAGKTLLTHAVSH